MKRNANPFLIFLVVIGAALCVVISSFLLFPVASSQPSTAAPAPAPSASPTTASPFTATPEAAEAPLPEPAIELPAVDIPPLDVSAIDPSPPIDISEEHTPEGMFITLSGSGLPAGYTLGPLARGAYAVGPNNLFLAYVSNEGRVFAIRLGRPHFVRVTNLKHVLAAADRNDEPAYSLSFYDAGFVMFLIIKEQVYGQTVPVWLPRVITY